MSNFYCKKCGTAIIDSPSGYITGCIHYPIKGFMTEEKELKYILDLVSKTDNKEVLTSYINKLYNYNQRIFDKHCRLLDDLTLFANNARKL